MPKQDTFADAIDERLAELDGYRRQAMFGGWRLYQGTTFFGIVFRQRLYFRTTPVTRNRYTAAGMGPCRYSAKQTLWRYYEVPGEVIADEQALLEWAREAVRAEGD